MRRDRYSKNEKALREFLRARRVALGLRQEDLAAKLPAHQSFVSKYESGERLLTFVETVSICHALGVDPHSLLQEYLAHYEA
jgi:transcriptional regulator with XRE-family HTH domain